MALGSHLITVRRLEKYINDVIGKKANLPDTSKTIIGNISQINSDLSQEVNRATLSDANLQTQIDQIVAPSGTAPNPAEIENARIGNNGVVYATLGNSIRSQIDNIYQKDSGINYLNKKNYLVGYWINAVTTSSAGAVEALSYMMCQKVAIDKPATYFFKYPVQSMGQNNYKVGLFNNDGSFNQWILGTYVSGSGNDTIISITITNAMILSGVAQIGYNQNKYKIDDNDMIYIGSYPSEYIPFNNYVKRDNLWVDQSQIHFDNSDEELEDRLDSYFDYPTIINYLNPLNAIKGKWINNRTHSPAIIEPLSYMYYNMAEINSTGDYYMHYPVQSMGENNYKVPLYNANGGYIQSLSGVYISGSGNDTLIKLSITNDIFDSGVRIIGFQQSIDKIYGEMIVKDSYPNDYIDFNYNIKTADDLRIVPKQIIAENPLNYISHSVSVFTKGFFAGDSLTLGTFNRKENGSTVWEVIKKYSYPAIFEKITGVTASNWGIGGENTKTYYEKISRETIANDYDFVVIALGANDLALNDLEVSEEYYQLLIDYFKSLWKGVRIFCCTVTPAYTATNHTFYDAYNDMVRNMVKSNANCYLIDLARYSKCKLDSAYSNGHLTAIGYAMQAKEVANAISYWIDNEPYNFNDVQFIGTDYHF